MSYWWPILSRVGVPTPRTELMVTKVDLLPMLDDKTPEGFDGFLAELRGLADRMGYPCFLRTGQISGKHRWSDCCFVPDGEALAQHVFNLVEWSHIVDMFGLPHQTWVVREMVRVLSPFVAKSYVGMPVT